MSQKEIPLSAELISCWLQPFWSSSLLIKATFKTHTHTHTKFLLHNKHTHKYNDNIYAKLFLNVYCHIVASFTSPMLIMRFMVVSLRGLWCLPALQKHHVSSLSHCRHGNNSSGKQPEWVDCRTLFWEVKTYFEKMWRNIYNNDYEVNKP